MALQIAAKTIETAEEDYLLGPDARDACFAEAIAAAESLELTETHWGLVNYFRTFCAGHMRHPTMHEAVMRPGKHHGKAV